MEEQENPIILTRLSTVEVPPEAERTSTGIPALDVCLAPGDDEPGGLPAGSSILLSGAPGGGKSTLALLAGESAGETLILHGEESAASVKRRWLRLGLKTDPNLCPLAAAEEAVRAIREAKPKMVIIDSIQTMSLNKRRNRSAQTEALELLIGQGISSGAIVVGISHVNKSGEAFIGDNAMAHLVDIHLHLTMNAKRGKRTLEIRKNRHGRAGFDVPLAITLTGIEVGTPTVASGIVAARSAMEKAAEVAMKLLQEGRTLTSYDFGEADVSGGAWRAGLELAVRRLARDGVECEKVKVGQRGGYRLKTAPPHEDEKPPLLEVA